MGNTLTAKQPDSHNKGGTLFRAERLASVPIRDQTSCPSLLHPGLAVLNQFQSRPN